MGEPTPQLSVMSDTLPKRGIRPVIPTKTETSRKRRSYRCSSKLEGEKENGPAPVTAGVTPGLTAEKERLLVNATTPPRVETIESAQELLKLSQDDLDAARRLRLYYISLARGKGLTYEQIGEGLGLTEAGVRQIIYRSKAVK